MYGNPGLAAAGWKLERMIPEFTRRAVELIEAQGAVQERDEPAPYFLYFPLTSPHSPIVPNEEFHGKSGTGPYRFPRWTGSWGRSWMRWNARARDWVCEPADDELERMIPEFTRRAVELIEAQGAASRGMIPGRAGAVPAHRSS